MSTAADSSAAIQLGQGYYWQDIHAGQCFRTIRRTVTETDLVNFISVTGMLEAIFIDAEFEGAAMRGRAVPAALVWCGTLPAQAGVPVFATPVAAAVRVAANRHPAT